MITRTTKYTANDGTEHDSPQAAAAYDLQKALEPLMGLAVKDLFMGEPSSAELAEMARELARNPEALRDALNTYFEDLEAHPDVDDPANVFHDMVRTGLGVMRVDPAAMFDRPQKPDSWTSEQIDVTVAEDGTITSNGTGNFQLDGDPDDPSTWRVEPHEGEVAPGVRGFEMEVPTSSESITDKIARYEDQERRAKAERDAKRARNSAFVDHPQYCRPFGTRED